MYNINMAKKDTSLLGSILKGTTDITGENLNGTARFI